MSKKHKKHQSAPQGFIPWYKRKTIQSRCALGALVGGVLLLIVMFVLMGEYRRRAGSYDMSKINNLELPSVILDRNGEELGRFYVQNRSVIPISDVPQNFINALLASEDSRFLKHHGVDYVGTLRALKYTFEGSSQGGSTLTQQLARNAYDLKTEALERKENVIQRKFVEAFLAMRIEDNYSKQKILEFYLNRIYFGSGYYGIRSAALGYFGKEPKELSTDECASIVTLIKNPYQRSPLNNIKANHEGRNYVLGRMLTEKMITKEEYDRFVAAPLVLNPKPFKRGASHMYERVADAARAALGDEAMASGGFNIHTTILKSAQDAATKSLLASLAKAESRDDFAGTRMVKDKKDFLQGAVLMIDHEKNEILAYVGGRDYAAVPYDFIEFGHRPLGTAFFPYVYAAALESGKIGTEMLDDEPIDNRSVMIGGKEGILGEWGMEIAEPRYQGKITMREAFEFSKIAATTRLATSVGMDKVAKIAGDFGFSFEKAQALPRMALGWEAVSMKQVVKAMSAFPRLGKRNDKELVLVDRIENQNHVIVFRKKNEPKSPSQAVSTETAWQVHSLMQTSMKQGNATGVLDKLKESPFHGACKSGSSSDFSDAWFVGYNQKVTCAVWTGYIDGRQKIYDGAFGRDMAQPVWLSAMNAISSNYFGGMIAAPSSIKSVEICKVSGCKATSFCLKQKADSETGNVITSSSSEVEYFKKGQENIPLCSLHSGMSEQSNFKNQGGNTIAQLAAMNIAPIAPIAPTEPVLIGDDPYHTEATKYQVESADIPKANSVLDDIMVGREHERSGLKLPTRATIHDED